MDLARERLKVWGYTAAQMRKLFESFDLNNDQLLDIDEFSTMLSEMRIGLTTQRVAELFDTLDVDKSGYVDHMEFAKALFPEQYIEEVRQRASLSSNDGNPSSPKSNHSPISPKGGRLLRSLSGLSQHKFANSNKVLRRSLSSLSNINSKVKRHAGSTQQVRTTEVSSPKSPKSPKLRLRTDEHPSFQLEDASPPLPFEERPTTVPKSTCQSGFISEASCASKEELHTSGVNCNGYYSVQSTTIGCTESVVSSTNTDSPRGVHQL